jgi:hypothetical protein
MRPTIAVSSMKSTPNGRCVKPVLPARVSRKSRVSRQSRIRDSIASVKGSRWISSGAVTSRFCPWRRNGCVNALALIDSVLPTERAHAWPW